MALKIFSGTSNQPLSDQVAKELGMELAKAEVTRFGNSEVRVRIEEDVKHDTCVVIQSTANPTDTNLMELYLMCDALRRVEARRVIGVVPYFGYARQNIQHRTGECVSANVVIRFMEAIGFHKIYTFTLHDEATEGVFNIPFRNLSPFQLLAAEVKTYLKEKNVEITPDTVYVVSPDQGGIERARHFGEELFGDIPFQIGVAEKKRDLEHIHQSRALDLYGDVKDKMIVIVDDVVTSGSTLINAAEAALEKGATGTLAAIVHHDFKEGIAEKLQSSHLEAFFTTNTIALKDDQKFAKLKEVSVASLIAEELKNLPTINQ
ncbi:ribose-phosphate diphosphokinase [soil metagenome]